MPDAFGNKMFGPWISLARTSTNGEEPIKKFIAKKWVIGVIAAGLLGQAAPAIQHEKEFYSRPFGQIVKEHQSGKENHSLPEPEELSGYLVHVDTSNAISGDTASTTQTQSWHYSYKLLREGDNSSSFVVQNS